MTAAVLAGATDLGFALFHAMFWRLFNWPGRLPASGTVNSAITQTLNVVLIYAFCAYGAGLIWLGLDEWLRHRLRAIQLKHWKRGTTMHRALRALGASSRVAQTVAGNSRCWWRNSDGLLKTVMTITYFDRLGVPRLS